MQAHVKKTPLETYFMYFYNKEIYYIFKACCIISVLFSRKCHLFHNFIIFFSNDIHIFLKPYAKI